MTQVTAQITGRPPPKIAAIEWVDPPFTAGHWVPDLVTAAGGLPVAYRSSEPSIPVSWPKIAATAPGLVVVAPCGYHLAGAVDQAHIAARALPGLPVWAIDADGIIVRPGPRLVTGVEALSRSCTQASPRPPHRAPSSGSPETDSTGTTSRSMGARMGAIVRSLWDSPGPIQT